MSETATGTDIQKRDASVSNNWDALNGSAQFGGSELVEKKEQVAEAEKLVEIKNEVEGSENPEVQETKPEVTETTETKKEEVTETTKTEEVKETKEEAEKPLEFTPEDVGIQKELPEDSWLKLGKDFDLELTEDTDVAFKVAYDNKLKAAEDKGRALTKDVIFSELKPNVALALKRMEAGMNPDLAANPTGHIDQNLKLSDTDIVRADLELREGWDADRIDTHMEILNEDPRRLTHEARIVRDELTKVKGILEAEATQYLQEYEQNKLAVVNQQAEQRKSQIADSLKSMKEFMGGNLPDATREAMVSKLNQGGYNDILNDPKTFAEFIAYKTLGPKAFKAKLEAEYQRGKLEKAKDLAAVPPVTGSKTGNQKEQKINQINNWDALERSEFAEKK